MLSYFSPILANCSGRPERLLNTFVKNIIIVRIFRTKRKEGIQMNTEQQYTTEQLNDMITACNEVIHEARQANETAAAVLEFDKTENEGLIISANPQGQMMGFYIFRSVPIIRKVTDSPREMAESLLTFIGQFYQLHGGVEDSITLSVEASADLAGIAAMAGAEAFGN